MDEVYDVTRKVALVIPMPKRKRRIKSKNLGQMSLDDHDCVGK